MSSISKYICAQDNFQKQWNDIPTFYFEKTDIINLKSSEKFPFRATSGPPACFCSFPEFKQKMFDYIHHTPTRTFSSEMAKIMIVRGTRNAKKDCPVQLSSKNCSGILSQRKGRTNEFVSISWDTIRHIFLEGKEEGDKIILPNNVHLQDLIEKTNFCMYSNQHTKDDCYLFSCRPFQVDKGEEKGEENHEEWVKRNLREVRMELQTSGKEEGEINYEDFDDDEERESDEEEIDYGDEPDDDQ